jgi:uncharacterized protein (TIGR02300 family)
LVWPEHTVLPRREIEIPGGYTVGKVDLGMKLTCESCGARFYDLNKQPAICPKCGAKNARPQVFRNRRPAEERAEKAKLLAAAAAAAKPKLEDDADVEAVEDDEAEDVIEDTSDLGEDDEDVEVVVEKDEPT